MTCQACFEKGHNRNTCKLIQMNSHSALVRGDDGMVFIPVPTFNRGTLESKMTSNVIETPVNVATDDPLRPSNSERRAQKRNIEAVAVAMSAQVGVVTRKKNKAINDQANDYVGTQESTARQ
ncbi:uncharacterized protein LOC119369948 [Jatropha curcas]|uniref:uncharacterized protein LOC119369948 n=1 Tax=Jatropha curcas TaxID=180498 RepID=UPI001893EAE4|nr:uncharacterized protein LOC119369948 [Jatropha curcas]